MSFDENGADDFTHLMDEFEDAWLIFEQEAGSMLKNNEQDMSMRAGIILAGYKPKKDMKKQAVEWWMWGECLTSPSILLC